MLRIYYVSFTHSHKMIAYKIFWYLCISNQIGNFEMFGNKERTIASTLVFSSRFSIIVFKLSEHVFNMHQTHTCYIILFNTVHECECGWSGVYVVDRNARTNGKNRSKTFSRHDVVPTSLPGLLLNYTRGIIILLYRAPTWPLSKNRYYMWRWRQRW